MAQAMVFCIDHAHAAPQVRSPLIQCFATTNLNEQPIF